MFSHFYFPLAPWTTTALFWMRFYLLRKPSRTPETFTTPPARNSQLVNSLSLLQPFFLCRYKLELCTILRILYYSLYGTAIKTSSLWRTSPLERVRSHPERLEGCSKSTCHSHQSTPSSTASWRPSLSQSVQTLPWPYQQRARTRRWLLTCRGDWGGRSCQLWGPQRSPQSSSCSCDRRGWMWAWSLGEMRCCRHSGKGRWPRLLLLHLHDKMNNREGLICQTMTSQENSWPNIDITYLIEDIRLEGCPINNWATDLSGR